MEKIKIMLVDDQMLLREGLKTIINLQEDMEVTAEAGNGKIAVDQMEKQPSDIILMDIRMPVMDGVEATSIIKKRFPKAVIIILTTFDDDDYVIEALSNGAVGYLLKDIDADYLIRAIQDAYHGEMILPGRIAAKLAAHLSGQSPKTERRETASPAIREVFTDREREIALLMAKNLSNRQIARQLFLTEGTVKNYISEIYSKLGTNNRDQAAMLIQQMYGE